MAIDERDQHIARLQASATTSAEFLTGQSRGVNGNGDTADTTADAEWQHRYQTLEGSVCERNEVGFCFLQTGGIVYT